MSSDIVSSDMTHHKATRPIIGRTVFGRVSISVTNPRYNVCTGELFYRRGHTEKLSRNPRRNHATTWCRHGLYAVRCTRYSTQPKASKDYTAHTRRAMVHARTNACMHARGQAPPVVVGAAPSPAAGTAAAEQIVGLPVKQQKLQKQKAKINGASNA